MLAHSYWVYFFADKVGLEKALTLGQEMVYETPTLVEAAKAGGKGLLAGLGVYLISKACQDNMAGVTAIFLEGLDLFN